METIKNQGELSYEILEKDFKTLKDVNFKKSLEKGFYTITYSKFGEGYITYCLTSDLQFDFKKSDDGEIVGGNNINHKNWTSVKNYLAAEQNALDGELSRVGLKIIPIEKMKEVTLETVDNYLKELDIEIEDNQDWYKKRVKEITDYGIQFC